MFELVRPRDSRPWSRSPIWCAGNPRGDRGWGWCKVKHLWSTTRVISAGHTLAWTSSQIRNISSLVYRTL